MENEEQVILSSEEAGAFVTQWAENQTVSVADLAARLGIDETRAASMLRQARGRLSMERWLSDKQPKTPSWRGLIWPVLAALLIGGALGCFITGYLMPTPLASAPPRQELLKPEITASVSQSPAETNSSDTSDTKAGAGTPATPSGEAASSEVHAEATSRQTQDLSGPEDAGAKLGQMMAQQTISVGRPISTSPSGSGHRVAGPSQGKYTPTTKPPVDLTDEVNTKIPNDLQIELETPDHTYFIHGVLTKNYKNAQRIHERDLEEPIQKLLQFVIRQELGAVSDRSKSGGMNEATVRVRVGRAAAKTTIAWESGQRDQILKQVGDFSSPLYTELCVRLVKVIHALGQMLFMYVVRPQVPAK